MKRAIVRAIDTNVVVRFLTGDHPVQAKAARKAIEDGNIFVPLTVWLESEWVLRSGYGFSATQIADGFAALAGLRAIETDDPINLATAISWMREGMDFADALHLTKAQNCDAFLTFDKQFAKAAKKHSAIPVQLP
jgi:predicted nucleic-acid-binding protein